jgi:small subunit ribosomal protein S20
MLKFNQLFDKIVESYKTMEVKPMPQIKSQIKRAKTNEKQRLQNISFKNSMRSAIKAVEVAVANNDAEAANTAYSFACKKLDKAVSKGIEHKNYVARQKSRLAKHVNSIA